MAPATSIIGQSQADFALKAKTRLLERGLTVKDLAQRLGFARNTVSMAINHPTVFPSVKEKIKVELKLQ